MQFRQFHIIQSKHDGSFLRADLTFTHIAARAGRLYDIHEAIDTARYNLGDDYVIFSAYELVQENADAMPH